MDITSIVYIVFVGASLLIYWCVPKKIQWIVLTIDSLFFYFLNIKAYTFIYLLISVFTIWGATNYFKKESNEKNKKIILVLTLVINVGILAVLKYTNLAINTVNFVLERVGGVSIATVSWLAPLAISYYTLQIVSYLLDSYWGVVEVEKNPMKVLLFTCYFPLMISGPINRYEKLGTQLFEEHRFEYNRVTHGMKRIAWGLLKKLAISDRLALMVNVLWNNVDVYNGLWIWIAVLGYVFQLYTNFSGCMDIVIGVSECFGIQLEENFKAPLLSRTIQEFWQRWHITLGQWLRDYIMNPLLKSNAMINLGDNAKKCFGKKKGKKIPAYISMLAVWLAMGLWHGNSWKYIIGEGLWFWVVIVLGQVLEPVFEKWKIKLKIKDGIFWNIWQITRTNIIFAVGMVFFRASSLTDAIYRMKESIGLNMNTQIIKSVFCDTVDLIGKTGCVILPLSLLMLFIYDICLYRDVDLISKISEKKIAFRWFIYVVVILIICCSYYLGGNDFAYAQF